MKLDIKDFGGIIPRLDPFTLPESAAQTAHNVDLSGGTIKPFKITNTSTSLHDDAGDMVGEIPSSDIAIITKPSAVSLSTYGFTKMCVPLMFVDALTGTWTKGDGWTGDNTSGFSWGGGTDDLTNSTTFTVGVKYRITVTISGDPTGYIALSAMGYTTNFGSAASLAASTHSVETRVFTATAVTALSIEAKNQFAGSVTIKVERVYSWINIRAYFSVETVNVTSGYVPEFIELTCDPYSIEYTDSGFIIHYNMGSGSSSGTVTETTTWTVGGPYFQVEVADSSATEFMGGPNALSKLPSDAGCQIGMGRVPNISIPMYYPSSMDEYVDPSLGQTSSNGPLSPTTGTAYQYGSLSIEDVTCSVADQQYTATGTSDSHAAYAFSYGGGEVAIKFSCNFVDSRPKSFFYKQQMVDASERQGPESDVSQEIIIRPGNIPQLEAPLSTGYTKNKIFRSASSEKGFVEIAYLQSTITGYDRKYYFDTLRTPVIRELYPNGNVPHSTTAEAVKGSIRHPAGFAVYYYGTDIRPSSEWIDTERFWAVPQEYAYTFESNILCLALSGDTILAFTDKVYRLFGQNPKRLSVSSLSDHAILNKLSLWKIGNTVGWVNEEGIVVYDGSEKLLTGEYYRAEQWQDTDPEYFSAVVNDRSVLLTHSQSGHQNLRFDLRGGGKASISTFDSTTIGSEYTWKSKIFVSEKSISWKCARVTATEFPVKFTLYGDGRRLVSCLAISENSFLIPRMPKAKQWEIEFEGNSEIRHFEMATSLDELQK
jgi:hypothetical protein